MAVQEFLNGMGKTTSLDQKLQEMERSISELSAAAVGYLIKVLDTSSESAV